MAISDRKRTEKNQKAAEQTKKSARDDKKKGRPAGKRKSSARRDASHKGSKSRNPIVRYFQETGDELRKVAWPSREQAVRLTVIVLGSTIATAVFFGVLDRIFQFLASFLV